MSRVTYPPLGPLQPLSSVVVGFYWGFCISTPYNFSLFRNQFTIFTLCLSFFCIATLPKFTQNTEGKVAFYRDFMKVETGGAAAAGSLQD